MAAAETPRVTYFHACSAPGQSDRLIVAGNNSVTVWYDSACPLCQREIALMRRLDRAGRIDFIDAADPATACPLDQASLLARFHAEENGVLLSGAAAFAAMWRAIPVLRPLGRAAQIPLIERFLNRVYARFLRIRPRLQAWLR